MLWFSFRQRMNKYFGCWKCQASNSSSTFTGVLHTQQILLASQWDVDQPSSPWLELGHWPLLHYTLKPSGTAWRTSGTLPSTFLGLASEDAWGLDAMQLQSPSCMAKCFRRPNISVTLNYTLFQDRHKKANSWGFLIYEDVQSRHNPPHWKDNQASAWFYEEAISISYSVNKYKRAPGSGLRSILSHFAWRPVSAEL